MKQKQTVITIS